MFQKSVANVTNDDGQTARKVPRMELPTLAMNDEEEQQHEEADTVDYDQSVLLHDCVPLPSTSTTDTDH